MASSNVRLINLLTSLFLQPKDLIYRSISDYEELYSDLPLSEAYRIYEKNESNRQGKKSVILKALQLNSSWVTYLFVW